MDCLCWTRERFTVVMLLLTPLCDMTQCCVVKLCKQFGKKRTLDLDSQWTLHFPDQRPPTCCSIRDRMHTNTIWLIPSLKQSPPRPLCLCVCNHYRSMQHLTPQLPPRPHVLILFGMRCQAMVSVNTAPGNSDRKPSVARWKMRCLYTPCTTHICSDN